MTSIYRPLSARSPTNRDEPTHKVLAVDLQLVLLVLRLPDRLRPLLEAQEAQAIRDIRLVLRARDGDRGRNGREREQDETQD